MNEKQRNKYNELMKQVDKHLIKNNKRQARDGKTTYKKNINAFVKHLSINYGSQNFKNLNDKHIISFVNERQGKVATKTLLNELSAIRKLHSLLPQKRYEELIENEDLNIKRDDLDVNNEKVDRAWTSEEYQRALDIAENMGRNDVVEALTLTRHFGTRINEVTALTRQQLQESLKKGYLHLTNTKNGVPRDVPLETNGARNDVERILERNHNDQLFIKNTVTHVKAKSRIQKWIRDHRPKFENRLERAWSEADGREKARLTHHGIRHMYARERFNEFKEQNMTDKQAKISVSHRLGHGRDAVTNKYL